MLTKIDVEKMLDQFLDNRDHRLIDYLKTALPEVTKGRLGLCDSDALTYFLAEIILPQEEYEIAAIITEILDNRGVLRDCS